MKKSYWSKKLISIVLSVVLITCMFAVSITANAEQTSSIAPTFSQENYADYPIRYSRSGQAFEYNGSLVETTTNGTVTYNLSTVLPDLDSSGELDYYIQADVKLNTFNEFWQTPTIFLRSYEGSMYGVSFRTNGIYIINEKTNFAPDSSGNGYYEYKPEEGKVYTVTVHSEVDRFSVWVNGEFICTHILTDGTNETTDYTYMIIDPAIKFYSADAEVSNIHIYNKNVQPTYNNKLHTDLTSGMNINITNGAVTSYDGSDISGSGMSGSERYWFSPAPATGSNLYFSAEVMPEALNQTWAAVHFHLTSNLSIALRDDIFIFDGGTTIARTYNDSIKKVLVTQKSGKAYHISAAVDGGKVSVWIDGVKYLDSIDCSAYLSSAYNISVRSVYGSSTTVNTNLTVKNFKIWNDDDPEPVYDSKTQTSYNNDLSDMIRRAGTSAPRTVYSYNGSITENGSSSVFYNFDTPISTVYPDGSYYYSAVVSADKITNNWAGPVFYLRGNDSKGYGVTLQQRGALVLNQSTGGLTSATGVSYSSTAFKLTKDTDYRITVYSKADRFSLWINGKAVFYNFILPDEYKNLSANPSIRFVYSGTAGADSMTVKDISVWNDEKPIYHDFSVYDAAEDDSYLYEGQEIISQTNSYDMLYFTGLDIKRNTPFYMNADICVNQRQDFWNGIRFIPREGTRISDGFYGSIQVLFRQDGIFVFGVDNKGDHTIASNSNISCELGRKYQIRILTTVDSISVWIDGNLYINSASLKIEGYDFTNIPVNPRVKYFPTVNNETLLDTKISNLSFMTESVAINAPEADEAVYDMFAALPAKENIKLEHEEQILAAKAAYEALTEQQKALVTNVYKLTEAEEALLYLKTLTGDANNDGIVDISDLVLIQRQIEEIEELSDTAYTAADADADGLVESDDLEIIRLSIHTSL